MDRLYNSTHLQIIHGILAPSRYLCSSSRFHLEGWSGLTFNRNWWGRLGQASPYPRTRSLTKASGGCLRSHLDVSVPPGLSWNARPGPKTRQAAYCYSSSPEHNITTNWRTKTSLQRASSPAVRQPLFVTKHSPPWHHGHNWTSVFRQWKNVFLALYEGRNMRRNSGSVGRTCHICTGLPQR